MAKPGDAVIGPNGEVGVVLAPGQLGAANGSGFFADDQAVMSCGSVYVRPVTDVRKGGEVMAVGSGKLAMYAPGRLPGRAVVLQDAYWGSDAKAGELALLQLGFKAKALEYARLVDMGVLSVDEEERDDESLPDWHLV